MRNCIKVTALGKLRTSRGEAPLSIQKGQVGWAKYGRHSPGDAKETLLYQ